MRMIVCILMLFAAPAYALNIDAPLADAASEARAQNLFKELRCVVCQGESIADSPAGVASDMRRVVRQSIEEGKSDGDIIAMLTAQYGERVLMMPQLNPHTMMLWFAPLLLLVVGAIVAWRNLFKGGRP